jgi:hypothetical protein
MAATKKSGAKRSSSTSSRRRSSSTGSRSKTSHRGTSRSTAAKKSSRSRSSSSSSKSAGGRKYSRKAQSKVGKAMHEYKHGKLKSGGGAKVKSRKQAIAIGINEARRSGAKVPRKKAA